TPGGAPPPPKVVSPPELVALRIRLFADMVGDERVVASTDCGLGGRIYPSIAWAKLAALTEGARLASK
ncbi:MAG: epoxyalkane--coenzyme M transferase, partial [Schaalia hyovaginalis]|nr:epoxyalkane--coenzyme M transferase [Schaalia hyovaginalis]